MSVKINFIYVCWVGWWVIICLMGEVVDFLGLSIFLDCKLMILFGGECQWVVIGWVFLLDLWLLIMDELLVNLDQVCWNDILFYFDWLCSEVGILIFYVSYLIEEVVCLLQILVILFDGKMLVFGFVVDMLVWIDFGKVIGCYEVGVFFEGVIIYLDEKWGLMYVDIGGVQIQLLGLDGELGEVMCLCIWVWDVVFVFWLFKDLLICNVVKGEVCSIIEEIGFYVEILCFVGEQIICVWIIWVFVLDLVLMFGKFVIVLIKSVVIDWC